jgi:hypothetical protein
VAGGLEARRLDIHLFYNVRLEPVPECPAVQFPAASCKIIRSCSSTEAFIS